MIGAFLLFAFIVGIGFLWGARWQQDRAERLWPQWSAAIRRDERERIEAVERERTEQMWRRVKAQIMEEELDPWAPLRWEIDSL